MRFNLLGPLEVVHNGTAIPLGGLHRRAILGFLLLHENRVVSTSQLIEALWRDDPPPTARKIIHNAVAGLRTTLSAADSENLITQAPGYLLRLEPDWLDLLRFQSLTKRGSAELARGAWERAIAVLEEALALWRGPVLADLVESGIDWPHLTAVSNARLAALEECTEAQLAVGRHYQVVAQLEPIALTGPPRERLCAQLMLALYRCGRQADALSVYRHTRDQLVEKLGLDPGRQLQDLERAILAHDPSLALAPADRGMPPQLCSHGDSPAPPAKTAAPSTTVTERKFVSVLLVDAPLNTQADDDPEVVGTARREVVGTVIAEAERRGGIAHSSVGSVHMALFGVPNTREDDAEQAVRTALGIRESLCTNEALSGWYRNSARSTVITGEVLVRYTQPMTGDCEVAGTLVDDGMRLLMQLSPGEVRVCDRTQRSCEDSFACVPADSPGEGFEVIGPSCRPASPVAAPLIGRHREMRVLRQEWAAARRTGRARLVTVVGEAGMGKSRLVSEFGLALDDDRTPARFLVGRANGPGTNSSLTALGEILRSFAGIGENGADAERKLARAVNDLVGRGHVSEWLMLRLSPLLNSRQEHDPQVGETLAAFRRLLEEIAARRPLAVVFEDIHRFDDTLLDFLAEFPEQAVPVPTLLIVTTRPETSRAMQWNGRTLMLEQLSEYHIDRLVEDLAVRFGLCGEGADSLTGPALERFRDALVARIGGVPLFATEYVRMLRDGHPSRLDRSSPSGRASAAGWIDSGDPIAVPQTVHNVVAARVDRLSPVEKEVLRDAAVIGTTVRAEAVAAVGDRTLVEATRVLEDLVQGKLMTRGSSGAAQERSEYTFRHVLVQDIAYSQLSRDDRAKRHRRAADWLATTPSADPDLVAHHERLADTPARSASKPATTDRGLRSVVAVSVFEKAENLDARLR
ncbi:MULTISPECIES: BTAD domain-containing putative transcriptional regulator [unclassified Streptomyces]|uniref:BTAD domain-containing putative transcriptional regulator n=1 Tax=unclassified Streptomyces TaxID=2593676 RepID=UPI0033F4D380